MHGTTEKRLKGLETLNLNLRDPALEIEHLKYASTAAVLIDNRADEVVIVCFAPACVIYIALEIFMAESLHLCL